MPSTLTGRDRNGRFVLGRKLTIAERRRLTGLDRKSKPKKPKEERFWEKVDKQPGRNACWLWTASQTGQGYGQFEGRAHRTAWELTNGPIPDGHDLHHTCGVKLCVRPSHNVPMTHLEHQRLHGNGAKRWKGGEA